MTKFIIFPVDRLTIIMESQGQCDNPETKIGLYITRVTSTTLGVDF